MKAVFLILTGLLILLGGYLFLFAPRATPTEFADVDSYESARAEGLVPVGAPMLPACARTIELDISNTYIQAISFVCPETVPDDAYITEIESQFIWNLELFEGDRVVLRRSQ